MIIPPDNADSNKATMASSVRPEDAPPSYTSSAVSSESSLTTSTTSAPPPRPPQSPSPGPKANNFLVLQRPNHSIKGTYIINPFLNIPSSLLSPLRPSESDAGRKNLRLDSRNGSIDVEIHVVGDAPAGEDRKRKKTATLHLVSENGSISAKVRHGVTPPVPFQLSISARNGSVTVRLPRTFQGPITITACNGSVNFSDELTPYVTTFSEVEYVRKYFVGDFSEWEEGEGGWGGDEVQVDSKNGRVRVYFVDEEPVQAGNSKKGFFGRFGFS